jgi:UDP-glucose 4-epimerase
MHVTDLSVTHIKALEYINNNSKSITLNCGYGKGYSVLDIVKIFKKIKKNLTINIAAKRKGDVESVYADTGKFKKILKIKMKYNNINAILKSSIKWECILKNRKYPIN